MDPRDGLEPPHTESESAVLPLDERGMERMKGIEPSSLDWQSSAVPKLRHPH